MNLEALWLADNQVSCIEGLSTLVNLQELNLARNKIDCIGTSLLPNVLLTNLNLADNQIGSFKEVSFIARMPSLRIFALSDPDWGDNPVAALCNYQARRPVRGCPPWRRPLPQQTLTPARLRAAAPQTWASFTLKQLVRLDSATLTEEAKALAEATYMKKKMYYNMRMKTLRRNSSVAVARAAAGRDHRMAGPRAAFALLLRALRDAEREQSIGPMDEEAAGAPGSAQRMLRDRQLAAKIAALKDALTARQKEIAAVEAAFADASELRADSSDSSAMVSACAAHASTSTPASSTVRAVPTPPPPPTLPGTKRA